MVGATGTGPVLPENSIGTLNHHEVGVGCVSPNGQTFFTGDIAEILVCSRPRNLEEQDRIRAYLTTKWGLR